MLQVVHVMGQLDPSGAEMMLLSALPKFRSAGVQFTMLSTGDAKGALAQRFEAAGCQVLHLPFARSPGYFWRVWRTLCDPRWDVVHLHTERANFYFGLVALATGKTVLRTVHSAFSHKGGLRWRYMLQRRALQALGLRHVAISRSVWINESSCFGLRPDLVDNWFDDSSFTPATAAVRERARSLIGLPSDRFIIASVGNCSDVKNHTSLLHALAGLPIDQRPFYLHAGTEDSADSERRLASELGLDLENEVRFLGAVRDVPMLLHAADAFVMPSLYEGFGVAAVEALGSGLPAVFTDVPGLRDFKRRFPDVVFCEPTPAALMGALQKVMQLSQADRERTAIEQSRSARDHYGVDQGVQGYVKLYRGRR